LKFRARFRRPFTQRWNNEKKVTHEQELTRKLASDPARHAGAKNEQQIEGSCQAGSGNEVR
jgi:hypothetical protein